MHVCLCIGLNIMGDEVSMVGNGGSIVEKLFNNSNMTVTNFVALLNRLDSEYDVQDFCSVYTGQSYRFACIWRL
ncbi:hypothetical protein Fmac_028965 [Flemingia macrophylla]|uniref:Uncharacterized protein n=1 Tax=Flemingia macrophylla TaxID=520843 RepID=A0ABD1L929_9FABA